MQMTLQNCCEGGLGVGCPEVESRVKRKGPGEPAIWSHALPRCIREGKQKEGRMRGENASGEGS